MDNEILDPYFAVFNQHINDAGNRAKIAFIKRFSQGEWNEHIQPFEDKGIMSMFNEKPNKYLLWYAETVAVFVNENKN